MKIFLFPEIRCPSLDMLLNGQINYTTDEASTYRFRAAAFHSCDLGYTLAGGNDTRVCLGNGTSVIGFWSGHEPHCEGKSI